MGWRGLGGAGGAGGGGEGHCEGGWRTKSCCAQQFPSTTRPLCPLPPPSCPPALHAPAHLQADCLPDPADVFSFLKENGIGQEHALYYVAFATYSETRGAYAQADAVYQQGINRLAAPVDRLRAKFQEFQQRMVGGWRGGAARAGSVGGAVFCVYVCMCGV